MPQALLRLRRHLGRDDMKLLFNINAEFAHSLDERPIALRAKSAVFSSLADAILVSGPLTGEPVDRSNLISVREAVRSVPVLANTGVTDRQCPRNPRHRRRRGDRHPFQGRRPDLESGRGEAGEALHGRRGEAEVMAAASTGHSSECGNPGRPLRSAASLDTRLRGYDKACAAFSASTSARPRRSGS